MKQFKYMTIKYKTSGNVFIWTYLGSNLPSDVIL